MRGPEQEKPTTTQEAKAGEEGGIWTHGTRTGKTAAGRTVGPKGKHTLIKKHHGLGDKRTRVKTPQWHRNVQKEQLEAAALAAAQPSCQGRGEKRHSSYPETSQERITPRGKKANRQGRQPVNGHTTEATNEIDPTREVEARDEDHEERGERRRGANQKKSAGGCTRIGRGAKAKAAPTKRERRNHSRAGKEDSGSLYHRQTSS